MVRKIVFLFTIVFMLVILSACEKSNTATKETPRIVDREVQIEQKIKPIQSDESPKKNIPETPEGKNTSNYTTAYIRYGKSYLPVSYVKDGKEVLKGDGGWYSDVKSLLPDDFDVSKAQIYSTRNMYVEGTKTPYDIPLQTGVIHPGNISDSIATNGVWEPFPVKVRYERYTLENQPKNETWLNYFGFKIHEVSPNTPVIITEAWFFDLNGDGIEEAFVNANNTFYSTEDNTPNPPAAKVSAVYAFSAVFLDSFNPIDIASNISEVQYNPLNDQKQIFYSYQISEESPDRSMHFITAIQYDANGDLITSPIFNSGEYDRPPEQQIIISDIDGDKQAELITMGHIIYAPIIVYRMNNDGTLVESFRMTTPP